MRRHLLLPLVGLLATGGSMSSPERTASPPAPPKPLRTEDKILFRDGFDSASLDRWDPDRADVWSVRRGVLRADLPDAKQQHSLIYTGSPEWTDYAVDFDVCAMRGVDKGVVVRVLRGETGIGIDLRGPGYQDVILHRREWPLGKASTINANGVWHHVRVEARGHTYRVLVNGVLRIDKPDRKRSRERGGIALAAYTGGTGECTIYFDNVLATALPPEAAAGSPPAGGR